MIRLVEIREIEYGGDIVKIIVVKNWEFFFLSFLRQLFVLSSMKNYCIFYTYLTREIFLF